VQVTIESLTFRGATPDDTERIAEIIAGEPGQEAIGITGSAEYARRFGLALVRLPNSPQGWQFTVVGEINGEVVGIMQGSGDPPQLKVTPAIALLALRTFGLLGVPRLLPRMMARSRVQVRAPRRSYHVAELDVDPRYRNRGIGGALLDYAEKEARATGYTQMSLSTTTINPARRLYERHGFRVVETRTDPAYERYTGIEGRVLMVKDLE
jgi:ribosomal protein S18 acetylase RimI-like enzyme